MDNYLLLYNATQLAGWTTLLVRALKSSAGGRFYSGNGGVRGLLLACQTLAGLELVHVLVGAVRAKAGATALQWAGRSAVLWWAIERTPAVQRPEGWIRVLVLSWAAADVIRYVMYLLASPLLAPIVASSSALRDVLQPCVLWLRYQAFIIMYPAGFAAEIASWLAYRRALLTSASGSQAALSRSVNGLFAVLIGVVYPAAFVSLYGHMWQQRKRQHGM